MINALATFLDTDSPYHCFLFKAVDNSPESFLFRENDLLTQEKNCLLMKYPRTQNDIPPRENTIFVAQATTISKIGVFHTIEQFFLTAALAQLHILTQ